MARKPARPGGINKVTRRLAGSGLDPWYRRGPFSIQLRTEEPASNARIDPLNAPFDPKWPERRDGNAVSNPLRPYLFAAVRADRNTWCGYHGRMGDTEAPDAGQGGEGAGVTEGPGGCNPFGRECRRWGRGGRTKLAWEFVTPGVVVRMNVVGDTSGLPTTHPIRLSSRANPRNRRCLAFGTRNFQTFRTTASIRTNHRATPDGALNS